VERRTASAPEPPAAQPPSGRVRRVSRDLPGKIAETLTQGSRTSSSGAPAVSARRLGSRLLHAALLRPRGGPDVHSGAAPSANAASRMYKHAMSREGTLVRKPVLERRCRHTCLHMQRQCAIAAARPACTAGTHGGIMAAVASMCADAAPWHRRRGALETVRPRRCRGGRNAHASSSADACRAAARLWHHGGRRGVRARPVRRRRAGPAPLCRVRPPMMTDHPALCVRGFDDE